MTDTAARPARRAVIQGAAIAAIAALAGFLSYRRLAPDPAVAPQSPYEQDATVSTVLAALADIPAGGGLVLPDKQIVLTRGSDDKVAAFSAVCPHQRCLVSTIAAGVIGCACHGSGFDASTGAVTQGPATTPLPPIAVTVTNGNVVTG